MTPAEAITHLRAGTLTPEICDQIAELLAAPVTVQEAARDQVAFAMWKHEAVRAAPNVGKNRTPDLFAEQSTEVRGRWLGLADAALRALIGGDA